MDAPEAAPIQAELDQRGWSLGTILITHHHDDHVQAVAALRGGARVIGAYNDNTNLGQQRAMIVWNRLILPDNQTVEIGAYGGDAIGRSGMAGVVNTHFGARFGSAALSSLIGLAPAIALADEDDDDSTSDVADAISQNMMEATSSALDGYLNRQPTIAIDQGTLVTIMVDRDLEIF